MPRKVEIIKANEAEIKLMDHAEKAFESLSTGAQHILAVFYHVSSVMMRNEGSLGPTRTYFFDKNVQPCGEYINEKGEDTEEYVEALRQYAQGIDAFGYITLAEMWGLKYDDPNDPEIGTVRPSESEDRIEGVVFYIESAKGESAVATCEILRESESKANLSPLSIMNGTDHPSGQQLQSKFAGILAPKAQNAPAPDSLQ